MWLHLPFSRSSENVQHCFTRKVTPLFLSALKTLVALSNEHAHSLISHYSMWTIEHTGFLRSLGRVFKFLEQKLFVWYKLGELKVRGALWIFTKLHMQSLPIWAKAVRNFEKTSSSFTVSQPLQSSCHSNLCIGHYELITIIPQIL